MRAAVGAVAVHYTLTRDPGRLPTREPGGMHAHNDVVLSTRA